MRRKSLVFYWLLVGLASGLVSACVDGHAVEGTRPGHEPEAGVDASAGDGDGDGDGDQGDGDGDGDGDMPDAGPPPRSCDPTECEGSSSMFGDTAPCCTDDGFCGLDTSALGVEGCVERDAPGELDSSCPSANILGFVELPGCCARGGKCGHLIRMLFPVGCLAGDVNIPIPGLEAMTPAQSCSTFTAPE
jgi:hypothetical protein